MQNFTQSTQDGDLIKFQPSLNYFGKKKTLTGKPKKSDLKSPRDYKPISGIFAFRKNFGYGGALGKVRWLQLTK
jgi:hypothetical protein